ncbi:MAG TPA: aldehyde dehydrogenase, partial [Firmicutes bacterium]|nr:aldehyde dehydrogenase [Bacillota bacterium]
MKIKNLDVFDKHYDLFIGGEWTPGHGQETIVATNPADGTVLSTFVDATDADVDDAVAAAQRAFAAFRHTSVQERSDLLLKIADVIEKNTDLLALQETLDNGKPIRETKGIDIPLSADHFRYFAGVLRASEGTATKLDDDTLSITLREPLGVVGQIIPWNFPFLMAAWKIAPALAMGNTIVIHPSSSTSLSLLSLMKLIAPILPKGVVNVVTGKGSKSGEYLQHHKGLRKLAFTGSTSVGREIALSAAQNLIPATLELGGKSADIFFDDMPYQRALEGAAKGILFNQGQVCCAGSRIFVQEGIYDRFVGDLIKIFKSIKVGCPWDTDTQMGAQVNKHQVEVIDRLVKIGAQEGKILVGGHPLEGAGAFYAPTLIAADNKSIVAQEEIFGPVAVVIKFKTVDEVIAMANDSAYGLGGAVWTRDLNTALKVAQGVQTGRMWVNTYNELP